MKTSLQTTLKCFSKVLLFALLVLVLLSTSSSAQELWGVLSEGGTDNLGTIGHYDVRTQSWIVDYNFAFENNVTARNPTTELTEANGKFYGMASGGANNLGELFEWDPATNEYATKVDFSIPLGTNPQGSLTWLGEKLYGMTSGGGARKGGVLFEFDPVTGVYRKLFDMDGRPKGSLAAVSGKLYGMTSINGANGAGVIFEFDPASEVYTPRVDLDCVSGCDARGRLTYLNGKFYGTTVSGGSSGVGTIFEWDPGANVITKKFDFNANEGANCHGSLTTYNGVLYGVTFYGGKYNAGVIFKYDLSANAYTKLFDFGYGKGRNPKGSLLLVDGRFYGLTGGGGEAHGGTLFVFDPAANTYAERVAFSSQLISRSGKNPRGSLVYKEGKFYGMTYFGGPSNLGTLFEWDATSDVFRKRLNFGMPTFTGRNSMGNLTYVDGKFYGITQGGNNNTGGIFEWNPAENIYSRRFDFAEGEIEFYPIGSLSFVGNKLWGATKDGENLVGRIFEYSTASNEYVERVGCYYEWGCDPNGPLTFVNGKFYGTTVTGGIQNAGVLFEWDPETNSYLTKVVFAVEGGANPYGPLTYHNGMFYGMTSAGGANNAGVIFSWDPATDTYIKRFDFSDTIGRSPYGALVYHNDRFYGMTFSGGDNNAGVIFEWNPVTNSYAKRVDFNPTDGSGPKGSLVYSAGRFFGVTSAGGANGLGVLFEWDPATNVYTKKVDFDVTTGGKPGYVQLVEMNLPPAITTPTLPASNIAFSSVLSTSFTVSLQPGDGSGRLAIIKAGGPPAFQPMDNMSYTGKLDNGETVVFNGKQNTFNVNGLQAYRRYYLTVFEYNADSLGNIKYLVSNAPVASQQTRLLPNVYLIKPGNGAQNQNVILTLKANSVEGATTYTFEVSKNSDFSGSRVLEGNISQLIDSLQYNTLYYAHVKTNLRGDYGKVTTFTTRTAESLAYVTWPAHSATGVPTKTAVASNNVPYASQYTIQLSEVPDFAQIAFEAAGPSRILHFPELKQNTTYYSRVLVNLTSVFGPVRSFTTQSGTATESQIDAHSVAEFSVQVYPNPFQQRLTLCVESSQYLAAEITLLDFSGQPVYQSRVQTNAIVEIDKSIPVGVYFLRVSAGGHVEVRRILRAE